MIWFPPLVQLSSSFSSFSSFSCLDSGRLLKEKGDPKVPTCPRRAIPGLNCSILLSLACSPIDTWSFLCLGTVQSVIRFPHYRQVTKGAPVIKPRGVEWRLHNPISPRTPPGCILPPGGIHSAPYPHFLLSESRKQGSRRHAAGRTSECLHLCTPDIAQTLSA